MRSFSAQTITALEAETGERVFLIEMEFSGGTLNLSTGTHDLSWDSKTWDATGGALAIGSVEETRDLRGAGVDLTLGGVDQTIINQILSNEYRGRAIKVWQAILDPVNGDVDDTILIFDGLQLNNYEVEERLERGRPATSIIRTRARHRLSINEMRGIRTNVHGHQKYYANSTFFRHVATIAGQKLYWGRSAPSTPHTGGIDPDDEGAWREERDPMIW